MIFTEITEVWRGETAGATDAICGKYGCCAWVRVGAGVVHPARRASPMASKPSKSIYLRADGTIQVTNCQLESIDIYGRDYSAQTTMHSLR